MLILPFLEEGNAFDLWDNDKGCFYDQSYEARTAEIGAYYCPSQDHDQRIIERIPADSQHGHLRRDPETGQPWAGSIADYRCISGSSCFVQTPPTVADIIRGDYQGNNAMYVDGALPQAKRPVNFQTGPGTNGRQVQSFRATTTMAKVTDGTSKTLMIGEVGRASSEHIQCFNGDSLPGYPIGEWPYYSGGGPRAFCERCTLGPDDGGDTGYGSGHPGVAIFALCDGSVRPINESVDLTSLDNAATRGGSENYDFDGVGETCHSPTGPIVTP